MSSSIQAPDIAAARLLLERLNVTVEDLLNDPGSARIVPTFGEYVPQVISGLPDPSTRALYGSYLGRIAALWPDRRLDEPTVSEFRSLIVAVVQARRMRKNDRGGIGAETNLVRSLRKLYECAIDDDLIREDRNPAKRLSPPSRADSRRQALTKSQVSEINRAARIVGNDPELDLLLLRFHLETACRRGGALALSEDDLFEETGLVRLHEKGKTQRLQPVSPTLMRGLVEHVRTRKPTGSRVGTRTKGNRTLITPQSDRRVFRYRNGDPISIARYRYLWARLGEELPWVAAQGVSMHWLRHTTLTWVDRHYGSSVAKAFAGHKVWQGGDSIGIYTKAGLPEIALALQAMTGEAHPCAEDAMDVEGTS